MTFTIKSKEFKNMEMIPNKYSMKGGNHSPPLEWLNIPKGTKSLVIIMEDIKGPLGSLFPITHWVLYNIPKNQLSLKEAISEMELKELGINQCKNFTRKYNYAGPAPPFGVHTYRFKIYSLDILFGEEKITSKSILKKRMNGHVIDIAELHGLYSSKS